MKVVVLSALFLFCAAPAGSLINDSHVNGTSSQLFKSADSHSAALLPTPETKAGASQGSLKILNSEADLPKDDKSLLKWKGDHFEVPLSATPFDGYLVRDQGGELKLSLVVDDQTKLSSSSDNKDVVRLEFPGTRRFMDIMIFFTDKEGYNIGCYENGKGQLANSDRTVTKFDLTIPAIGDAHFRGGDDSTTTKLSYSDVPAISIANSKEVVRIKVSVITQGAAAFSAYFEPGSLALGEPGTNAALIGGSIGGVLGLVVIIVVAVIVYKVVKKNKKKKLEKAAAASALAKKEDTTQLDEKAKPDKPRKTDETTTAPTKPAAQKESSKLSSVSIQEPVASKDGLGKTSADKKSLDSQEKSKQKSLSKKEEEVRPVEQVVKQEAVKETEKKETKEQPKENLDKRKDVVAGAVESNKKDAPVKAIKEGSGHSQKNAPDMKQEQKGIVKDKVEVEKQERVKETRAVKEKPRRDVSKEASQETVGQTMEETVCDEEETKPEQKVEEVKEEKQKKIQDPPPPEFRVVTAPIWNFTSRNSAKFARPPAVHLLPNHMPAANPAFFEKGQGTAYDDAVEGVRKQKEEAEQYAADVKAYEDREKGRPAIYRTKYHTGPDPLNAPLWNSEEDDVDEQNGLGGRGGRKKSRRSQ